MCVCVCVCKFMSVYVSFFLEKNRQNEHGKTLSWI